MPHADADPESHIVVHCQEHCTGSYGCILKSTDIHDTSGHANQIYSLSSLANCLQSNARLLPKLACFDAYSDPTSLKPVSMASFQTLLRPGNGDLAFKVIRARFKDPSKTSAAVFDDEVGKIRTLEDRLQSNFEAITTYRKYLGSCAFIIRPVDSSVHISIRHKPDYEPIQVDALYIILQDSCMASIENMFTQETDHALLYELDRNISYMLRILHSSGLCHGDIKPQNIVYCPNSSTLRFKLVDFGFSQCYVNRKHLPDKLQGTRMFMSPFYIVSIAQRVPDIVRKSYRETQNTFDPKTAEMFKLLYNLHVTGIRCSDDDERTIPYIMLKNDEYAYLVTLLILYSHTRCKRLLRKAAVLAMSTGTYFTSA